MRCSDPQIMDWFRKFVHHSFINRNILRHNARTRWGQGVIFLCCFFVTGGSVWWHPVQSVRKGQPFYDDLLFSNVCIYQFFSACVPCCAWLLLKRLLIKFYVDYCSIILKHRLVLLLPIICIFFVSLSFCIILYVRMSFDNVTIYKLVHVFFYLNVHRQRWRK